MVTAEERFFLEDKVNKVKDNALVIEVGSYSGAFTKYFMERFIGSRGIIFEPQEKAVKKLRTLFEDKNVQIFQFAVGQTLKWVDFYEDTKEKARSGLYRREGRENVKKSVPLIRLDMLCAIFFNRIEYLRINADGNELNVLKGARNIIKLRWAKFIQFDYSEYYEYSNTSFNDVVRYLNNSYTIFNPTYGYVGVQFDLKDGVRRTFLAESRTAPLSVLAKEE